MYLLASWHSSHPIARKRKHDKGILVTAPNTKTIHSQYVTLHSDMLIYQTFKMKNRASFNISYRKIRITFENVYRQEHKNSF